MRPVAAVINHLLAQEPWAQARLLAHRDKTACIDAGLAQLMLTVTGDGFLKEAGENAVPAVTIHVKLSDIPLILANRERAVSYVKIEGDADFANAISQLSQSLRWDAEEDLSKVVGDIAATRIVSGTKSMISAAQTNFEKIQPFTIGQQCQTAIYRVGSHSLLNGFSRHDEKTGWKSALPWFL